MPEADIYQQIWDADQAANGLRALKAGDTPDDATREHGFVLVDEKTAAGAEHRVIAEVHLPEAKQESYRRAESLFNNYTLDQTKPENNFPDEAKEIQHFLEYIHNTPPMKVAKDYVSAKLGRTVNLDEWWTMLERIWFEQFDQGANRDLSGFEHVVVGEQKQGKVQGYHFWYKYYLDEHFRAPTGDAELDLINFLSWQGRPAETTPEVVTLSYTWRAFDYEARAFRNLTKPIGGFWVGPSVEGLLALGTVRFLPEVSAPSTAVINGTEYALRLYRSPNGRNLRTFYPEFVRIM